VLFHMRCQLQKRTTSLTQCGKACHNQVSLPPLHLHLAVYVQKIPVVLALFPPSSPSLTPTCWPGSCEGRAAIGRLEDRELLHSRMMQGQALSHFELRSMGVYNCIVSRHHDSRWCHRVDNI